MLKYIRANRKQLYSYGMMVLAPIFTFYLLEFYTHNPFTTMRFPIQLLNIVFFELVMVFLFFLFGRLRAALFIESGLLCLIGLVNYFVIQFRSIPILPWDIFSLKTAASVADNYKYHLDKNAVFVLIGFLILFLLEWFVTFKSKLNLRHRFAVLLAPILLLWGFVGMLHQESTIRTFKIYDKLFTPSVMSKRDGTMLAFLIELQYLSVEKPTGYRVTEAKALLDSYDTKEKPADGTASQNYPNILVIMDEAFSDLNILGDFTTNEDYMPFIRDLMANGENTISGYMDVSILGGNTPNTEFEFLTGNSLAFLPQGSVPFQQYVKKELPSLPSHLKELGYRTIAMHPYHSTGWDRNRVYPLLGFEESYFLNSFSNAEYVRKYVSDKSCFDQIIAMYETKEEGTPLFLFNVTMQNHSSYSEEYDNFKPSITLENRKSKILSNYLSLLKLTDNAVADLIAYFEAQEEDTIIVFFGDHQPSNSVTEPIWKLQGKSGDSLSTEEERLRYKVPFFIWANYELAKETVPSTSPNYVGLKTLQAAGVPLSSYFHYLEELEETFPSISALGVTDQAGNTCDVKEQREALNTYQQLQYYQLFDFKK